MNILSYLFTSLIIVILPGTGVLYTISTGLTYGPKKSLLAAAGCTIGIIPHLAISLIFMGLLVSIQTTISYLIRIPGILYLLYLGYGMIRYANQQNITQQSAMQSSNQSSSIIQKAVLINLLNPKLTLFFFSFLPQYIEVSDRSALWLGLVYGSGFMIMTLIIFCLYGLLAGSVRQYMLHAPKKLVLIQRICGVIFIGLALSMIR